MAQSKEKNPPDGGQETFYQRFSRIVEGSGLSDTDIGSIMGLSAANVGRVKSGQRKSIRLDAGLRLCSKLDLDPWFLAFGRPRPSAASGAQLESHLPEGPFAEAVRGLQSEIDSVREIAEQAQALAEEAAKPSRQRGRGKSA